MDRIERIRLALRQAEINKTEREQKIIELESLVNKWKSLAEMTRWAELPSSASIKEGDKVRHLFKNYTCIKSHTKALTRSPINNEYWVENDE